MEMVDTYALGAYAERLESSSLSPSTIIPSSLAVEQLVLVQSSEVRVLGWEPTGCSSVGRALGLGPRGRQFKPDYPDHTERQTDRRR